MYLIEYYKIKEFKFYAVSNYSHSASFLCRFVKRVFNHKAYIFLKELMILQNTQKLQRNLIKKLFPKV